MRRQPFHRHQAAPRHATSKLGRASAEQTGTHLGVNTVGPNYEGRLCHMTLSESHLCILSRLANRNTFFAEGDRVRLQTLDSLGQNAEQVAAMKHDVRCAITLSRRRAEIEPVPGFTGAPVTYFARGRDDLNSRQCIPQAKRIQNPCPIGAKLDASSSLFEHGRLFVHVDIDTALEERQRRGEPAYAAANDCDLYRGHLGALHVTLSIRTP